MSNTSNMFAALLRKAKQFLLREDRDDAWRKEVFSRYGELARARGFKKLYFLLSFDCDTPEDAGAAERIAPWLQERNIPGLFFVPGAELRRNADTWKRLRDAGARFYNHGALPHAERGENRYYPITLYSEMTAEAVQNDIREADTILREVIEIEPTGFRAPHFSCFQAPEQRKLVHDTIRDLGYRFSSSTMPVIGLEQGPVFQENGTVEIPVSGSWLHPHDPLDSWSFLDAPETCALLPAYAEHINQAARQLQQVAGAGVFNLYVDPSHVASSEVFFRAMDALLACGFEAVDFEGALALGDAT